MTAAPQYVWLVTEPCDCDDYGCSGYHVVDVYSSEQTANQAADADNYPHKTVTRYQVETRIRSNR